MYNLTDKRFGRLLVIGVAPRGEKYPRQQWWRCRCDCGKEISLPTWSLTGGGYRSCGCLQEESRKVDVTGERRGSLTAVRPTEKIYRQGRKSGGSVIWVWRCDCGREIEAPLSGVGPDGRTSCGCKRRPLNVRQAAEMRKKAEPNFVDGTNLASLSSRMPKNNTTGVKGVSWHARMHKYQARITFKGKQIHLGTFDRLEDAAAARKRAEEEYFKPMLEAHKKKQ